MAVTDLYGFFEDEEAQSAEAEVVASTEVVIDLASPVEMFARYNNEQTYIDISNRGNVYENISEDSFL